MQAPDPDSRAWIESLTGDDERERLRAQGRLQRLVARAARRELKRRGDADAAELADEAVEQAGGRLLESLADYSGTSRFTLWAARFPVAELARRSGARGPACDECLDRLDEHVEIELVGGDPDGALPLLARHLDGCDACAQARAGLFEFALRSG
ncbi:MAG: hypothetical protein ACJ76V_11445 [Thermoleophilaceae bacterium]